MWANPMLPGRERFGRQQERSPSIRGLAVPSPGEETGQRLEDPLPRAGRKYRSQEGGGWGLTSHSRGQEKSSSACLCLLLTYQTLWKQNKQVLCFPGEHSGQREKGCDRPYESKTQGAVGLQEGFLEEGSPGS